MSDVAIEVKNLSKMYHIGHERKGIAGTNTFRDALSGIARKPAELLTGHRLKKEEFWALKDINFEVNQGDVVGIIGKNGSGKSTLLKILSQIVDPTKGEIHMRGRVASLLEVGTGFHPELTGRENIFFNGAILGMKRKEIISKFDEIVAFSEVERFLDTPVKFYSSGMYVRLAFAVAAHLDPDILIVDEVLAVGDAAFQKKSLGKMQDVAHQGRTVLFVSHNLNSVDNLCNKGIHLDHGKLVKIGSVKEAIRSYTTSLGIDSTASSWSNKSSLGNDYFTPLNLRLVDEDGKQLPIPTQSDSNMFVSIEVIIDKTDPLLDIGYALYGDDESLLYWSYFTDMNDKEWPKLKPGKYEFKSRIPKRLLNEGSYRIELIAGLYFKRWLLEPGSDTPSVYLNILGGLSDSPHWQVRRPGLIGPNLDWSIKRND